MANYIKQLQDKNSNNIYPKTKISAIYSGTDSDPTLTEILADKQEKLIAGSGITIAPDGKTISSTGGHPTQHAAAPAAVKVGNDTYGHVVLGDPLAKGDVGLGNVDNTSDLEKPISTATQTVLTNLDTRIGNLESVGRFLSIWNCLTGLPETNPTTLPYAYRTGDYYRVGDSDYKDLYQPYDSTQTYNIGDKCSHSNLYYICKESGVTGEWDASKWDEHTIINYVPEGSSYTGVASTAVIYDEIKPTTIFYYDSSSWTIQAGGGGGDVASVIIENDPEHPLVNSNKIAVIPIATESTLGVVQAGSGININNGIISVGELPTASSLVKGGVKVGSGLAMDGEVLNHSNSVESTSIGESGSDRTLAYGGTFTVPYVGFDGQGHVVTGSKSVELTLPAAIQDTHYTNTLTIQGAGTNAVVFDQSADKSLNIIAGSNVSVAAAAGQISISATDTTYSKATTSAAGLMSASDKTSLNTLVSGALMWSSGSGAPTTASGALGKLYIDTTNNRVYVWDGATWQLMNSWR